MRRLTYRDEEGQAKWMPELLEDDSGLAGVVIRGTLADYEETGLEPEEIIEMKARMEAQDGDYIEKEAAKEAILSWAVCINHPELLSKEDAMDCIDNLPAADVAEVRHGRWERVKNPQWPVYSHDKCSVCGWWNTKNALCYDAGRKPGHSLNFCPNCGAKMNLEDTKND